MVDLEQQFDRMRLAETMRGVVKVLCGVEGVPDDDGRTCTCCGRFYHEPCFWHEPCLWRSLPLDLWRAPTCTWSRAPSKPSRKSTPS